MNRLYPHPRPHRYKWGHGADNQHLVLPTGSDASLARIVLFPLYRRLRNVGVSPHVARQAIWYAAWYGSCRLDATSLVTPWIANEKEKDA